MSQPMNPTSNVEYAPHLLKKYSFSHDAYMHEYQDKKFYGYASHLQYLDYFVKTDVSRRDGQQHASPQKAQKKQSDQPAAEGGEQAQTPQQEHQVQVQNKPLIIAGDEGCGKTALVSHWLNHSPLFQQKHNRHQILLVHVAGASSCERKYQSFIHRALVKLRRSFPDVNTRLVHIIDDKLRINFSRCLDLVSNAIGTSSSSSAGVGGENGQAETEREGSGNLNAGRIIMILDGLENFRDSENDQGKDSEQSADWVPWTFPDRFRVIILTRKRSKAMNHFKLRKCPLLYMGDQMHFNAMEISNIIDEHVLHWKPTLSTANQDSFEGRLAIIKQELVVKREQIYKEQINSQRQQKESLSEDQLIVFKTLEEELSEGNYHLLARPADELESKFAKPTDRQLNPLVIRCILHFYLFCGSSPYTSPQGIRPLDMKIILSCKSLHQLFVTSIKHFRECLFLGSKPAVTQSFTPLSTTSKFNTKDGLAHLQSLNSQAHIGGSAEQAKEKFDQLMAYLIVSRKGITWQELRELIPTLNDEDIKLFQEIFGFLLIRYVPDNHKEQISQQTFVFFKHAAFKKAVKETIEPLKNDVTRAQLHKNLATLIERQEPVNQFLWQRRVDELCYHYQMSGMWIKLKDLISSVEVFSTMFVVPELRYELAQQWLWLLGQQSSGSEGQGSKQKSSKQQCDPVVEYNKALESFIIKYRPTSKELFVIMIQLCRFFKEDLAELVSGAEASEPQFAHPPLLGTREMEAIRLLKEVERLDNLYTPDREEDSTFTSTKQISTSSQLIASLKGFNLDNAIVRDQIIDMIRKEVRSQSISKEHQMISMSDEDATTHYHYKRWLWVQFPWCTIDVHSDISNIMELFSGGAGQGGDSSLYISATKENELAKATLMILHSAKQRSKKSYSSGVGNSTNKTLNQSQSSSVNNSLKKKNRKSGGPKPLKIGQGMGMLPPVVPQTVKHGGNGSAGDQGNLDMHKSLQMSKTVLYGTRSTSAGRPQRESKSPSDRLPFLRLDSEDRRSPEKTLAKISTTMAGIEESKMREIETENVSLGAQLNNLNFMIYRKEKELKQLEEHFTAIMIEHSVNNEGQHKLEVMEAKLLKAYEDLNRVEVERKRIEQIVKACEKNPPNNEEQIRNLEQQIDVFVKLISFHQGMMSGAHKEQEQYKKQLSELVNEMTRLEQERQAQIMKITDVVERKRRLQSLMIEGEEDRKNFAMFPIEAEHIDVGKLKQRQQNYKKWKAKLNVTRAFIREKRILYQSSFKKLIDIAGLRKIEDLLQNESPLENLEGLIAFIERANDLDNSKRQKETKIEKLKRDRDELIADLKKWENGVQLIECGHIERAQKKLYLEDKSLKAAKEEEQRQLSLIADLKSGFVNVAKILGIEEGLETESDQLALIEKICEKFTKLEAYRSGSKIDLGAQSESLSADRNQGFGSNESHRSSRPEDATHMLSPQGSRQRKKQPKQKQAALDIGSGKQSPQIGVHPNSSAAFANNQAASIPMKLAEFRENDVDSDTEERIQMMQDRLRMKKNISANGNYTLSKVGNGTAQPTQSVSTAEKDDKTRSASVGAHKPNLGMSLDKFKKTNITASNPIIGAPLGNDKGKKGFGSSSVMQIKTKEPASTINKGSQLSKPALANTKIPKYVKKTIKMGGPGRNGDGTANGGDSTGVPEQ